MRRIKGWLRPGAPIVLGFSLARLSFPDSPEWGLVFSLLYTAAFWSLTGEDDQ